MVLFVLVDNQPHHIPNPSFVFLLWRKGMSAEISKSFLFTLNLHSCARTLTIQSWRWSAEFLTTVLSSKSLLHFILSSVTHLWNSIIMLGLLVVHTELRYLILHFSFLQNFPILWCHEYLCLVLLTRSMSSLRILAPIPCYDITQLYANKLPWIQSNWKKQGWELLPSSVSQELLLCESMLRCHSSGCQALWLRPRPDQNLKRNKSLPQKRDMMISFLFFW